MIVYRELSSVEKQLGFSARTLYGLSNSISKHYISVKIPKRNGGVRRLSIPDKALMSVQKAIAQKLLAYEPVSSYAKAYKPASNVKKNAAPHIAKPKILKLDIKDFFDNIKYSTVKDKVFPSEKYSEANRILLAMLCYHEDSLPQGAPTSPIITNIIMREFDEAVGQRFGEKNIAYTRYCDDMTFSGDFDEMQVISFVEEELKKLTLSLNRKKTHVISSSSRQTVTGITVNKKLNIPKEYKRRIRQEIFFCKKNGTEGHIENIASELSPLKYLHSLQGKINYVLQITPENEEFKSYRKEIAELIKAYEFKAQQER